MKHSTLALIAMFSLTAVFAPLSAMEQPTNEALAKKKPYNKLTESWTAQVSNSTGETPIAQLAQESGEASGNRRTIEHSDSKKTQVRGKIQISTEEPKKIQFPFINNTNRK